ncbi:MAG: hypothetical protein R3B47_13815 [Bacteroidia bacterium]
MIRSLVISLWTVALFWVACQPNEARNETLDIPDPVLLSFTAADLVLLSGGESKLETRVETGPETMLNALLADRFAFEVRLNSLKLAPMSLVASDSSSLYGIDSVELSLRPANRDDYLPLAYLSSPVDSSNGAEPLTLQGFELADFIGAFPGTLAGELRAQVFSDPM